MGASSVAEKTRHGGVRKGAGRPPADDRKDASTRIDGRVLDQARIVCRDRGIPLAGYLSDLLREPVGLDFAAVVRKVNSQQG